MMPSHYNDLGAVHKMARRLLEQGRDDPAHSFRKPVLVTLGLEGIPGARTIILRDIVWEARQVRLHTHILSTKISEIRENPDVTLIFYDPVCEIQLQLIGRASIHTDDGFADDAWDRASPPSRRAYLASGRPGAPMSVPTSGLPADVEGIIPPMERLAEGRGNFAAIRIIYHQMDWLFLSVSGNRRAQGVFENENWGTTWLVP